MKNQPIKLEALVDEDKITIKILFGSVTGKAKVKEIYRSFFNDIDKISVYFKHFSNELMKRCVEKGVVRDCQVVDLKDYDPEDSLLSEVILKIRLLLQLYL